MADLSAYCFNCNHKMELMKGFGRREECSNCGADVHCCYNCEFYDKGSYNECKEPSADVVKEKDRANFCDFFQLSGNGPKGSQSKDDLLSAAEALFKK